MAALLPSQRKRLLHWLLSELSSAEHPAYKAAVYFVKAPNLATLQPSFSTIWKVMFPAQKYNNENNKVWTNLSILNHHIEDFIVFERLKSRPALRRIMLIEAQTMLKLGHFNDTHLRKLTIELDETFPRAPEYLHWQVKTARLKRAHLIVGQSGLEDVSQDTLFNLILKSSFTDIIRHVADQIHLNGPTDKLLETYETIKNCINIIADNNKNDEINFMLNVVEFYISNKKYPNIENINNMLELLIENKMKLPSDIVADLYTAISNYAGRYAFATGTKEARWLLWIVQYQGFKENLISIYDNYMSPQRFRLFVNSAVWSGRVSREELMAIVQSDQMRKLLPKMKGREEMVLCEVYYDMLDKNYDAVVSKLEKFKFKTHFYWIEAKMLIIKAMYENLYTYKRAATYDQETILIKVAYTLRVLPEYENIADFHREWFHTELNLLASLVRARSQYDLQRLGTRLAKAKMAGFSRFWFEDKIQERISPKK